MIATELRIGNYVSYFNNEILKVSAVFEKGIHDDYYNGFELDDIHPIQLTEEWLLKFGFYKAEKTWFNEESAIGIAYWSRIDNNTTGYQACKNNITLCDLEYIHELQNLHFALTGEELQII